MRWRKEISGEVERQIAVWLSVKSNSLGLCYIKKSLLTFLNREFSINRLNLWQVFLRYYKLVYYYG